MPAEGDFEVRQCLISNCTSKTTIYLRYVKDVKEEKLSQQMYLAYEIQIHDQTSLQLFSYRN